MSNSITTFNARVKFAKAHAGDITLPKVTQIAWGDGGVDINGNLIVLSSTLTQVPGEFLVKNVDQISFPSETTVRFRGVLTTTEGNGKDISSCGLYDSEGTLIAVKVFKPKAKDNETTIEIDWDEEF